MKNDYTINRENPLTEMSTGSDPNNLGLRSIVVRRAMIEIRALSRRDPARLGSSSLLKKIFLKDLVA